MHSLAGSVSLLSERLQYKYARTPALYSGSSAILGATVVHARVAAVIPWLISRSFSSGLLLLGCNFYWRLDRQLARYKKAYYRVDVRMMKW